MERAAPWKAGFSQYGNGLITAKQVTVLARGSIYLT